MGFLRPKATSCCRNFIFAVLFLSFLSSNSSFWFKQRNIFIYPQLVCLGRDRDGGSVEAQVLSAAVDVIEQLQHGQGAGGAHSQAVIRRPAERLRPAHRGQQRHHRVAFNRDVPQRGRHIIPV